MILRKLYLSVLILSIAAASIVATGMTVVVAHDSYVLSSELKPPPAEPYKSSKSFVYTRDGQRHMLSIEQIDKFIQTGKWWDYKSEQVPEINIVDREGRRSAIDFTPHAVQNALEAGYRFEIVRDAWTRKLKLELQERMWGDYSMPWQRGGYWYILLSLLAFLPAVFLVLINKWVSWLKK